MQTRSNSWKRTSALLILALAAASIVAAQQQTAVAGGAAAPDPRFIVGDPANPPLSGEALEVRTKQVASLLRCPVCQGLSVWDSPATMAVNMKHQVRELIAQGYSEDQILRYFEASYGEFVRLEPAMRGMNWLVYVAPLALLVAGGWITWRMLRRGRSDGAEGQLPEAPATVDEHLPSRDSLPDDPKLAALVLQVRELAYGWPGGLSPSARASREGESSKEKA